MMLFCRSVAPGNSFGIEFFSCDSDWLGRNPRLLAVDIGMCQIEMGCPYTGEGIKHSECGIQICHGSIVRLVPSRHVLGENSQTIAL
jgi:hypothetical protein